MTNQISKGRIKLSVALATFNEEKSLGSCLKSVKDIADEIIVIDGNSKDNTVKVAKNFGARVIVTENKPIFHLNKQKAIDECQGEWILQLDADEVIPEELGQEIKKIVDNNAPTPVAYWIKRRKMFLGRWIKKGGQYPDPVIRLFRKGKAYLPCKSVHEQMEVEGEAGWLRNSMIHLPTPSFSVYITKDNRYSTLTAMEMKAKNLPVNIFTIIIYISIAPLVRFLSLYIRHKGFLDGFPGFVFALYSGLHQLAAYIKYWEMVKLGIKTEDDWV